MILAPSRSEAERVFPRVISDADLVSETLTGIQAIRDRALREQTGQAPSAANRHLQSLDAQSWHVVLHDRRECIAGCARYRQLNGGIEEFRATQTAIAQSRSYGPKLRSALERLIHNVRDRGKAYGEAGGWALHPEMRGTTAGFNVALTTYALAEHLGSGLALTTATRLNQSASILRRIGARALPGLPAYYDARFASIMEIIHFDLPCLNATFAAKLKSLRDAMSSMQVICPANS